MATDISALPSELATIHEVDAPEAIARILRHVLPSAATDLYFTAVGNHYSVLARELGIVRKVVVLSPDQALQIIHLIKAGSGLPIGERRHPNDGRWQVEVDGHFVHCRVSTIGTLYGEELTLRILPRHHGTVRLEDLGFVGNQMSQLRPMLTNKGGLILVTGPVGNGKTTTLYACLESLNDGRRIINTIEDPVERVLPGVRQCEVQAVSGLTSTVLLRGILRQSPDVIMLNEITDHDSAVAAIRAANSGYLVFSSLHAPLAAGAIESLIALGVNPYFLSSCLIGVVAQKLVRRLNPDTRQSFDVSEVPQTFEEVREHLDAGEGNVIYGPAAGADPNQGYAGQCGLFEILRANASIKDLIAKSATAKEIYDQAISDGMLDFRRAGLILAAKGVSGIEEVTQAVPNSELG